MLISLPALVRHKTGRVHGHSNGKTTLAAYRKSSSLNLAERRISDRKKQRSEELHAIVDQLAKLIESDCICISKNEVVEIDNK